MSIIQPDTLIADLPTSDIWSILDEDYSLRIGINDQSQLPDELIPWTDAWIDRRARGQAEINALVEKGQYTASKDLHPIYETPATSTLPENQHKVGLYTDTATAGTFDHPGFQGPSSGALNGQSGNINPSGSNNILPCMEGPQLPPMQAFSTLPRIVNDAGPAPTCNGHEGHAAASGDQCWACCCQGLYLVPMSVLLGMTNEDPMDEVANEQSCNMGSCQLPLEDCKALEMEKK